MEFILIGVVIAVITALTFNMKKTHPLEAGFSFVVTLVIVFLFSSVPIVLLTVLVIYTMFLAVNYKSPPAYISSTLTTLKKNSHSKFKDL